MPGPNFSKAIGVRFSESTHRYLDKEAATESISVTELVRRIVDEYVSEKASPSEKEVTLNQEIVMQLLKVPAMLEWFIDERFGADVGEKVSTDVAKYVAEMMDDNR